MKVYGYPRSGNHFLMRTLWLTYYRVDRDDYRSLFGAHFDAPACTPSLGNAPYPGERGVIIIRDACAVARSVWNMREWFGLTSPKSFDEFLTRKYSDSYVPGAAVQLWIDVGRDLETIVSRDSMFSEIHERPIPHQARYREELLSRCDRVVEYEELVAEPKAVIRQIGEWFDLPAAEVVVPSGPIGFNVRHSSVTWTSIEKRQ